MSDLRNRTVIEDVGIGGGDDGCRYRSTLVLEEPMWADTGFYECHYQANDSSVGIHNSDRIDEIYVYVQGIGNELMAIV